MKPRMGLKPKKTKNEVIKAFLRHDISQKKNGHHSKSFSHSEIVVTEKNRKNNTPEQLGHYHL